jgi:DNA-binding transcriptional regulator YdaS (Cro superfamily)
MEVQDRKVIVRELIELACSIKGSQTKLGEACGYSQNAIWQAIQSGSVTAEMALAIHRATKGAVSAARLRPDLWAENDAVPPVQPEPSQPANV